MPAIKYTGLDRFGRVVDQKWVNSSGTTLDESTYTYDRDSNALTKGNGTNSALSEAYTYDNLNRLTGTTRNSSAYQSWTLDPLDNMSSVTTSGTSVSRTNNSQNQLTALGSNTLAYDGNGNTTTDEQGRTLVYDAWNRLVEAKSGSTSLIRYGFDALGRKVKEATNSIYFDDAWQEIEDRNSSGSTTASYAWSPVYINALITRDRDTDANGTLDERLYPTQDANWNVTSIVNTSGTMQERFSYDVYGKQQVYDASWTSTTDSKAWRQGFQGGFKDSVLTNLMLFQHRMYDTDTMRWEQEDPLGANVYSTQGLNLNEFVADRPTSLTDFSGFAANPLANPGPVGPNGQPINLEPPYPGGKWVYDPQTGVWTPDNGYVNPNGPGYRNPYQHWDDEHNHWDSVRSRPWRTSPDDTDANGKPYKDRLDPNSGKPLCDKDAHDPNRTGRPQSQGQPNTDPTPDPIDPNRSLFDPPPDFRPPPSFYPPLNFPTPEPWEPFIPFDPKMPRPTFRWPQPGERLWDDGTISGIRDFIFGEDPIVLEP